MKREKNYEFIKGIIKDSIIIILIFCFASFIDFRVGVFIAVVSISIALTRRTILYLNPGFIKGYHIYDNEKELMVPPGVEVFDISKVPSFEYLYKYAEVIRGILIPPRIFIIRFCGIFQLKEFELDMLKEVIRQLQSRQIIIILSDVEENVRYQLVECEIEKKGTIENVFYSVRDALLKANQLKEKKLYPLHPVRFQ